MIIDADWDKAQWKKIKEIPISNFMGDIPAFRQVVKAKMMYDQDRLSCSKLKEMKIDRKLPGQIGVIT